MPKVSIIVPIYNGSTFLPDFIEHINNFSFKDFETIFVDNNSSDDSVKILNQLLAQTKFEFSILSEKQQGAGSARNLGISKAKGKYITFIDCDDYVDSKKIETDIHLFETHNVDYVLCRTERKYTDGRTMLQPLEGVKEGVVEPPLLGLIWLKNFFYLQGPGAIVAKTEVIKKLGGFHSSTTGEDAFLFIKLGLFYSGYYYNKVYNFYTRHVDSTISLRNKKKNGALLSYFNLRKNLINDELVKTNKEAITILNKQLNVDIFKLCSNDKILVSELIYDERLKDFKLDSLLINKLSLMINKIIPNIKYNPFFYLWRRIN
ncbi:glycosyltransferase family 2 protein [Flavobacterium piscinae]|uniref:Glycosyltransferase family 2 protein n=1 Tax=Flavobacterium piscinae TaxID=2506424 RepID=A0A4Q1KTT0_9FLAO|nr:glycosyltransferase family 2 protein [Flavobacterium piscinae]RXR33075.1 glycosyltransferase family 2 protein [Flavobacterium piscinae]